MHTRFLPASLLFCGTKTCQSKPSDPSAEDKPNSQSRPAHPNLQESRLQQKNTGTHPQSAFVIHHEFNTFSPTLGVTRVCTSTARVYCAYTLPPSVSPCSCTKTCQSTPSNPHAEERQPQKTPKPPGIEAATKDHWQSSAIDLCHAHAT